MSRQNKVNPNRYKVAGRLSPDDLARERFNPASIQPTAWPGRRAKPLPPWMSSEERSRSVQQIEAAQHPGPAAPRKARPVSGSAPSRTTSAKGVAGPITRSSPKRKKAVARPSRKTTGIRATAKAASPKKTKRKAASSRRTRSRR